jgi:hypothetical protein
MESVDRQFLVSGVVAISAGCALVLGELAYAFPGLVLPVLHYASLVLYGVFIGSISNPKTFQMEGITKGLALMLWGLSGCWVMNNLLVSGWGSFWFLRSIELACLSSGACWAVHHRLLPHPSVLRAREFR